MREKGHFYACFLLPSAPRILYGYCLFHVIREPSYAAYNDIWVYNIRSVTKQIAALKAFSF